MENSRNKKTKYDIRNYNLALEKLKLKNSKIKINTINRINKDFKKFTILNKINESQNLYKSYDNKNIKESEYKINQKEKNNFHKNNINKISQQNTKKLEFKFHLPKNIKIKESENNNFFSPKNKNNKINFQNTASYNFNKNLNNSAKCVINKTASNYNINALNSIKNEISLNKTISNANLKNIKLNEAKSSFNNPNTFIYGYSVNTTNGIVRNYNEDRVSIVVNIKRNKHFSGNNWPNCSYFGVFDGHGGTKCADFLKENLHLFIINSYHFPNDPIKAIEEGFILADDLFLKKSMKSQLNHERSGSCAIIFLIVNKKGYFANVGDSRAVGSIKNGRKIICFTNDHKPEIQNEKLRIENAGGYIYQSKLNNKLFNNLNLPFRICPGGLSVSRAFGDIYAKSEILGGNPKVLISKPEITIINLEIQLDFIILGCDGIWDKFGNKEIIEFTWNKLKNQNKPQEVILKNLVNEILIETMRKNSLDNLTIIFIALKK